MNASLNLLCKKKFLRTFIIIFNLVIAFSSLSFPQQLAFKTYNRASGLPSDYILCIYQDRTGYVWFGTDRGASRYDGKSFTTYSSSNGLGNNFVMCINQDQKGSMWFGLHEGGVTRYDQRGFKTYTESDGLKGKTVENILEDMYGRIYFDVDGGITLFYKEQFSFLALDRQSCLLTKLKDGSILIGDSKKLRRIIPTNDLRFQISEVYLPNEVIGFFIPGLGPSKAITRTNGNVCLIGIVGYLELSNVESGNPKVERKFHAVSIESISENQDGKIWCGTENQGILRLEKNQKEFFECVVKKSAQNRISASFCDYEGNLWFGTMGSGVQKFLGSHLIVYNSKSGLTTDDVTVIMEDGFNRIWLGTRTGVSIIANDKLINLESKLSTTKEVRCFTEDAKGNIYIGTFDQLFGTLTLQQILSRQTIKKWNIAYGVSSLYCDRTMKEQTFWLSTYGGGTYQYTNQNFKLYQVQDGMVSNMIESIVPGNNSIWFLSRNNGASNFISNTFQNFSKVNGLPSNTIFCVYEEIDNIIWFGTDEGLVRLTGKKIKTFSAKDGLIGKNVLAIFPANEKNKNSNELWVVTNESLHKYRNDSLYNYGSFAILPSSDASINNVYHRKGSSILWLANTEGAVKVDLSQAHRNLIAPKVEIESAFADTVNFYNSINYSNTNSSDSIAALSYLQNDVTINFSALGFSDEQKVKYIYRLEGFDDTWSSQTSERKVRYRNLYSGRMTFKVYAINADGVYSIHPAQITFIITPPFWRTGWFILISAILFFGILIGTIRYYSTRNLHKKIERLEHEKHLREEREKTRTQISRDLHDDISSTLGSIALYSESFKRQFHNLSEQHKTILDRISSLASEAIDHMGDIIWSVAPEHDTLNEMLIRMKNFTVEFCSINRIEYEINVQELATDFSLQEDVRRNIYLIFKEALNNIIKHANATKVTLTTKYHESVFELTIEDNGKGFEKSRKVSAIKKTLVDETINKPRGHGLSNMKRRSEVIGAELLFESSPEHGTKINFKIRMT
ncbi:MAG: two-component regulator propeller domain-containing protein [Melioribacteraceae bacterium]